jgi:hypothetical protein
MSTLRTSIVLLALLVAPAVASATPPMGVVPGGPRLRPDDSRSAALVLEGLERSETLRSLVDRLEERNVIVYVQWQPTLRGRLAGSLTWIAAAGRYRYVRVSWSPDLSMSAAIATLGHELQHAVEVANEPSIVSAETLEAYYRAHGISMTSHNGWDTIAARDRGDTVRREIAAVRSTRASGMLAQGFSPESWHELYRQMRGGL